MNVIKLFRNGHVRAETMPSQDLVRLIWSGQPNSEEYRAAFLSLLHELAERPHRLLLMDERRMGPRSQPNMRWYNTEVLPALKEAGVKRIGVIGYRDGLVLLGGVAANGAEANGVAYFDNVSMAMLWLLDNGKADIASFNEQQRLATLRSYRILDTEAQASYDDITLIASAITHSPIALISLVDSERQWFKSCIGIAVSETPREVSFCSHAIENPEVTMVIPDATKDPRFANNPLVTSDPNIRFYAGAPLVSNEGNAVGTLCVIDRKPRELDRAQLDSLAALARLVVMQLEYRQLAYDLKEMHADLELYQAHMSGNGTKLDQIMDRQISALLAGYPKSNLDAVLPN